MRREKGRERERVKYSTSALIITKQVNKKNICLEGKMGLQSEKTRTAQLSNPKSNPLNSNTPTNAVQIQTKT